MVEIKVKMYLHCDEWYPYYFVDNNPRHGKEVFLTEEFIKKYEKTVKEFDEMHGLLVSLYEE
jgi:hypothetical protein